MKIRPLHYASTTYSGGAQWEVQAVVFLEGQVVPEGLGHAPVVRLFLETLDPMDPLVLLAWVVLAEIDPAALVALVVRCQVLVETLCPEQLF